MNRPMLVIGLMLSVTGVIAIAVGLIRQKNIFSRRVTLIIGAVLFVAGIPFLVIAYALTHARNTADLARREDGRSYTAAPSCQDADDAGLITP